MKRVPYDHPNYREIEDRVRKQFREDFNNIPLDVVEKYYNNSLGEHIVEPNMDLVTEEWLDNICYREEIEREYHNDQGIYYPDDRVPFTDWVQDNYRSDLERFWLETNHYPSWATVFEANSSTIRDKILQHIDELYELGIGVIEGKEDLDEILFINGGGYDFYEAHWIPMYILFGWLDESLLE